MITTIHPLGSVSLTNEYFSNLAALAAKSCYGVAAFAPSNAGDSLKSFLLRDKNQSKGVQVREQDGRLVIDLHIMVGYGLNIQSIVASITHRVRHTVEHATGLPVAQVNVFVDDILSDD